MYVCKKMCTHESRTGGVGTVCVVSCWGILSGLPGEEGRCASPPKCVSWRSFSFPPELIYHKGILILLENWWAIGSSKVPHIGAFLIVPIVDKSLALQFTHNMDPFILHESEEK